MKGKVKELLLSSGADDCGIVKARIYSEFAPAFGEGKYPFCEKISVNPFEVMEEAKSVIVFVVSYSSKLAGNISSYAFGRDYHKVLPEIAQTTVTYLRECGYSAEVFADSGTLPERHLAYLASLGFIGKNHCLIHPIFGSFVFIGYILTNCPIEQDEPLEMSCLGCRKCLEACPSGALKTKDFFGCLSYVTQKKGELGVREAELIKKTGTIWGCDICQRVCPHNLTAPESTQFSNEATVNLAVDEDISNSEFKRKYAERAFAWRGKGVLLRNQKLIKG